MGYRTSASAVLVSLDRIKSEQILNDYDFQFHYLFDECSETIATGEALNLITENNVDVLFGPTCNRPAITVSAIAAYYNIPVFEWGLTTSKFLTDHSRFPTTISFSSTSYSLSIAIYKLMQQFDWTEFVFVYSNDGDEEKCDSLKDDIQNVNVLYENITLSYMYKIKKVTMESLRTAVKMIKIRGRIIVACFSSGTGFKKAFMESTFLENASDNSFVYIMAETNSRGFYVDEPGGTFHYLWEGKNNYGENITEEETNRVFRNLFFLTDNMGMNDAETAKFDDFSKKVINRMKDPPFNCVEDCSGKNYSSASKYAGQLADAFYAYAKALNKSLTLNSSSDYRDGFRIMQQLSMTFIGISGAEVLISENFSRKSIILLSTLNNSLLPEIYAKITVDYEEAEFTPFYTDEYFLWDSDSRPLSKPICGFTGLECPPSFVHDYLIYTIIVAVILFVAILAAICGTLYSIRMRKKEKEEQDSLWHIDFIQLLNIPKKGKFESSQHSFSSAPSISTKATIESKSEKSNVKFFFYKNEIIAALKHGIKIQIYEDEKENLRKLLTIDNDNLNRFIGLCLDAPQILSIWRYCSRGSLADVIQKSSLQMDYFFKYSLIRDISNGLSFIHFSFLNFHGNLTSKCCLIDDRWQIKISDYGLNFLRDFNKNENKNLLWTAPELLRNNMMEQTKEQDIFSFAIICSEIITKKSAYDLENRKEKVEEILYKVKRGGHDQMRPSLDIAESNEMNQAMLHLIRDCWAERPSERPTIQDIQRLLKGMNDGNKGNLMDHVFNMLESYASSLEEEVSERTKELVEEKKKSDVLLYRMLPRSVADKLKIGQTVEPETFELVTIFFSDVVSFTKLASKCSPLQVVTLLNDLYSIFDGIIEQHDVYKVETIGDGYLCVSGLPHRNGNEHCRHIARMALGFLASLQYFRISHLPNERINLRIGINCGSVVAGVVGLTMPRYCLFGDAVNTASRMESNGKPGQIHLSADANKLLTKIVGGFRTESRGEVIIKGKGVMETFWLLGEGDEPIQNSTPTKQPKMYQQFQMENNLQRQETLKSEDQNSNHINK